MNKKANTLLFVLGATVVNVIVMMLIFLILFVLFARFLAPGLSPQIQQVVMLVIFVGSIVATYFIYHRAMKWLSQKYDMEKYFDPIFRRKR
jgi:membrane protein YdbS with pleckstrin-like domain